MDRRNLLKLAVATTVSTAFTPTFSLLPRSNVNAASTASNPITATQRERDNIYLLLAYSVVLKDWQSDADAKSETLRGHNIGSVLVDPNGKLVSWARNASYATRSAAHHGEVRLILSHLRSTPNRHLKGYTIYSTLEPCVMCTGMMIMTKVSRAVHGQRDPDFGSANERLSLDTRPKGYPPYPRPLRMERGSSAFAGQLERAFGRTPDHGMPEFLRTPQAHQIYENAAKSFLSFDVKYPENNETYQTARAFLKSVSGSYIPLKL